MIVKQILISWRVIGIFVFGNSFAKFFGYIFFAMGINQSHARSVNNLIVIPTQWKI